MATTPCARSTSLALGRGADRLGGPALRLIRSSPTILAPAPRSCRRSADPDAAELVRGHKQPDHRRHRRLRDDDEGHAPGLFEGHAGRQGADVRITQPAGRTAPGAGRNRRGEAATTNIPCTPPPRARFATAADLADKLERESKRPFPRDASHRRADGPVRRGASHRASRTRPHGVCGRSMRRIDGARTLLTSSPWIPSVRSQDQLQRAPHPGGVRGAVAAEERWRGHSDRAAPFALEPVKRLCLPGFCLETAEDGLNHSSPPPEQERTM